MEEERNYQIKRALKSAVDLVEDAWWYVNEYTGDTNLNRARHSADTIRISQFLQYYNDNLREPVERDLCKEKDPDACCDNEDRNMNGGCNNCGDPCL